MRFDFDVYPIVAVLIDPQSIVAKEWVIASMRAKTENALLWSADQEDKSNENVAQSSSTEKQEDKSNENVAQSALVENQEDETNGNMAQSSSPPSSIGKE